MNALPKTPGVYLIKNLQTGKVYVGSTINLKKRKQYHWADLCKEAHPNIKLQRSWNIHKAENFIFEIIEYVEDKTQLLAREQIWIDTHDAVRKGYNLNPKAGSQLGFKHSNFSKLQMSMSKTGRKLSKETCKRMADSRRGIPLSYKTRMKISKANKGQTATPEQKERMWVARKNSPLVKKHLENLIRSSKGRVCSQETRNKISIIQEILVLRRIQNGDLVGASWDKSRKLWTAKVKKKGKTVNLGRYRTAQEAHEAYLRERYA